MACAHLMGGTTLPSFGQEGPGTGRTEGATSLGYQPLVPFRKELTWGRGCMGNLYPARAGEEQDGMCSIYSLMSGFVPTSF